MIRLAIRTITALLVLVCSACSWAAKPEDPTLVAFMTLETMFTDKSVRTLAKAAGNGQIQRLDQLVKQGVDVNATGRSNATPLFWAMKNLSGFTKLLTLGANANVVFDDGSSVMHWAAKLDDTRMLKAALQHGGNANLKAGDEQITPIFEALGNQETMDVLLDNGADINAKSQRINRFKKIIIHDTPLLIAAQRADYATVLYLLKRGADHRYTNENGISLASRVADAQQSLIPSSKEAQGLRLVVAWLGVGSN